MNSKNQNNLDGETSRIPEVESSSKDQEYLNTVSQNHTIQTGDEYHHLNNSESAEMKRAAAKKLIERYFYQLREGCGNLKCNNKNCASSGEVKNLTPDQAAAKAIQLYSQDAQLCEVHPTKLAKTQIEAVNNDDNTRSGSTDQNIATVPHNGKTQNNNHDNPQTSHSSQNIHETSSKTTSASTPTYVQSIDENDILRLIDTCHAENSYSILIRTLGNVFSSRESVAASFQKKACASLDAMLDKAPNDLKSLKKEDFRTLEGDLDKDEDSCADKTIPSVSHHTTVDLVRLRRAMSKIYDDNSNIFEPLNNAIQSLALSLSVDLRLMQTQRNQIEEIITVFVIIFEIFNIAKIQFLEIALPNICTAAAYLPIWAQARLAWIWAEHSKSNLSNLLEMLQQLITLEVISSNSYRNSIVQDNETIINATKVMKLLYYASILAGDLEPRIRDETVPPISNDNDELFQYIHSKSNKKTSPEDLLAVELGVETLDCRKPFLPFEDFYNEPLSEIVDMDKDFLYYKQLDPSTGKPFSFMLYSFILTPATKTLALYFDNRIRMYRQRMENIYTTQSVGQPSNPYLKLRVRRDKLIDDALVELEVVAMCNPKDLKKQLYVEFIGEQGVDEGGVSKEFFQLVVEQIFNADFGMFIHQEETNTVWFNSTSFENDGQFTLIGIVLGLAIYNNIILAVNFPMVVYRKLMGLRGTFTDLFDLNPVLYNSIKSMLDYQESDIEEVFMQTFQISYSDIFGNIIYHELKPNGDNIYVNHDNKQEFVELYSDFLLNQSIEKQFGAFRKGFQMVTDESPLHLLFRPEDIELLVCGSKDFDFNELEQATEYEGGYTTESQTIIDFWSIVHGLSLESKKKLLEFTTGSDRVPVGGLSKLKLVIVRHGPDCDRLPTSHTCFNVLLLPEYSTKEKLEERLLKAINYSKGFGMI